MPRKLRARRPLPIWKKTAFAVLTLALIVAAAESILFLAGVPSRLEREDPFRGFSGKVKVFSKNAAGDYTSDRPANHSTFNPQTFRSRKADNGFRVFVVGGSSAYGFPWGAGASFSSVLEDLLSAAHPELVIEVVNAAGISYASHRVRILVQELLDYQPDLLIVYSGHNEFIEKRFYRSLRGRAATLGRFGHLLHRSRLYGAVHLLLAPGGGDGEPRVRWGDGDDGRLRLEVRRDFADSASPGERQELEGFFAENLRAILQMAARAGVPVILCTTPANLRDWRPEDTRARPAANGREREQAALLEAAASAMADGTPGQAVQHLEAALEIVPHDAPTWFQLGRAYEALRRWSDARRAYLRACDFDRALSRATEGINRAIREVAEQEGVVLVDVEESFAGLSPNGLVGFNLIEDYVHPTREAHERIAFDLWQAMREAGLPSAPGEQDVEETFARVLAARAGVVVPGENTATFAYNQAVLLANQERWPEARARLEEAIRLNPGWADPHFSLGSTLLNLGLPALAEQEFRKAEEIEPEVADMAMAYYNLGVALTEAGSLPEALAHFESALARRPDYADAHNNMGVVLSRTGKLEQARLHLEAALRIQPDHPDAGRNLRRLQEFQQRTP